MNNLTYKVVYTPSLDSGFGAEEKNINFLCSDGKIHVRLRDYDHEEVVHGFIDKLTYLLTYCINDMASRTINSAEEVFKIFSDIETINIESYLKSILHEPNFKGIKLFKNYRKVKGHGILGSFSKGTCPTIKNEQGLDILDYPTFLEILGIGNLYTFLFNDAYDIFICKEKKSKDSYRKFLNKTKKPLQTKKKTLEYVSLL